MKHWILYLLAPFFLSAAIIETAHFSEIEQYADADTLFLLDIDDTLLIPVQMLGCDLWFMDRIKIRENDGMAFPNALEKALAEWEAVRHLTKMEIVEEGSEQIVQSLQEKGFKVMGLTTQGLALATRTSLQLKEWAIDLSRTAPSHRDEFLTLNGHGVLFRGGILFTSGMDKGQALFQLCEKIGYAPKKILFINDKASHLREVEKAAEERGVAFIGLRYAYSDARKAAYSPQLAAFQFSHSTLDHLLSDEEARKMLVDEDFFRK